MVCVLMDSRYFIAQRNGKGLRSVIRFTVLYSACLDSRAEAASHSQWLEYSQLLLESANP